MGRKAKPKTATPRKRSHLQEKLAAALQLSGFPRFEEEVKFHPTRRWRLDFGASQYRLGIECQGGTYSYGRHSRGPAQHNDYDKLNAAQLLGWRILYFDAKHIREIGPTLDTIRSMLVSLGWEG